MEPTLLHRSQQTAGASILPRVHADDTSILFRPAVQTTLLFSSSNDTVTPITSLNAVQVCDRAFVKTMENLRARLGKYREFLDNFGHSCTNLNGYYFMLLVAMMRWFSGHLWEFTETNCTLATLAYYNSKQLNPQVD
jgi:hypothetical protein